MPDADDAVAVINYSLEPSTGSAVVDVVLDEITRTASTGG